MDFLKTNPGLSGKVLSSRLRGMEIDKLVKKEVYNTTPVLIEYHLTQNGAAMNKILYELSMFGAKYYPEEVFGKSNVPNEAAIDIFGSAFKLQDDAIAFNKTPLIQPLKTIDFISD